jgi:hypothetical protein
MVASLAHGASLELFGLVARNGLLRGLHSVAPFGARHPSPATLKGLPASGKAWRGLSVTPPPCHVATPSPVNMPPCHVATMPKRQHATTSAERKQAKTMAWLGPLHNKDYPRLAFCLSALSSPRPPLALPSATAATAQARGWGRRYPPACSNPTLSHKLFNFSNTLAPIQIKLLCNSVSYVKTL